MTSSDQDIPATIHQAIQSARYNEAVIVTVSDDDDRNKREIVLVACLDREHGGIVWRDASIHSDSTTSNDDEHHDDKPQEDTGISRHLRTKLWAVPMLNDHIRNEMYNRSVRAACRDTVRKRMSDPNHDGVIRILDIGSGTGLIAMMAAKHCKDAILEVNSQMEKKQMKVQVTSCEMASAMARLARMTIHENKGILNDEDGVDCGIVVVECHSTDPDFCIQDSRFDEQSEAATTKNEPQKADICTSELLDSGLLGEGVLPSLRDAWRRHLKPDALVLPMSARVRAVLIEGCPISQHSADNHTSCGKRLNGATTFYGPELTSFKRASGGVWLATTPQSNTDKNNGILLGLSSAKSSDEGITIPLHANAVLDDKNICISSLANPMQQYDGHSLIKRENTAYNNDNVEFDESSFIRIKPLTDPKTVLMFDFASGLNVFPTQQCHSTSVEFQPTCNGVVDGVLFWWELDLDTRDGQNTYTTKPIGYFEENESHCTQQWQDHWQQCLFLFGDGKSSREVKADCPMRVNASHDDYSVLFAMPDDDVLEVERPRIRRKLDKKSDINSLCEHQSTINKHISPKRALQLNNSQRTTVLRDAILFALNVKGTDASLLDLSDMGLCAQIAAVCGKATSVTSLESSVATLAATVSQLGNALPHDGAIFQVIQALSENVTNDYIVKGQADIVVAEPYYQMLEGWHIQEALNYYYFVRSFKSRGLISHDAISVPSRACIMVCVVECKDFRNTYRNVGNDHKVVGFQHKTVNRYGNRYHNYDLSLPLWQYKFKRLTEPCCVATFIYEGKSLGIKDGDWVSATFVASGSADAVVTWVDYLYKSSGGTHFDVSTNSKFNLISTASASHHQTIRKISPSVSVRHLNGDFKFICRSKFERNDCVGVQDDHCLSFEIIDETKK